MRKIKEVLRLRWELGVAERQIAQGCGISRSTVWEYLHRAQEAGLSWPLPADMDDGALEALLFTGNRHLTEPRPEPDWASVQGEMKRKGVTLLLLWQEYSAKEPQGYSYVTFTVKYRAWRKGHDLSMRQEHKAGEKLFVDYAGMTLGITDPQGGTVQQAQLFVAVLGASNYTYVELSASQSLGDWLGSHRRAFEFFGGVPAIVVPDNLKAAVSRACRYEPQLNPAYADLAAHYGVAVIPARVRKPKDKAKVENHVLIAERRLLAPLRDRVFFSLPEANEAVQEALYTLNRQPFQKLPGSRLSAFEELDQPLLRPLPSVPYELAVWKKAKVNIDYHIEVAGHYYSVPYRLARESVELRISQHTLEVFHDGKRVAAHPLVPDSPRYRGRHSTLSEHRLEAHRQQADWTPERLIRWAQGSGEHTAKVVQEVMASRTHPEQGFRACLGIMRLGKRYSNERLEAACQRACYFRAFSFQSVQSILQKGLDSERLPERVETEVVQTEVAHPNVRGAGYYGKN